MKSASFYRTLGWDTRTDRYLREAMFGPEHPRREGLAGLAPGDAGLDPDLPGFGPFGTAGYEFFHRDSAPYVRIKHLIAVRQRFPVLRYGRQYQRPIWDTSQAVFTLSAAGQLVAWSRNLDDEEALCIINGNGGVRSGADVLVDPEANDHAGASFEVIANTEQAATSGYTGSHPIGQQLPVKLRSGKKFVEIRDIGPSEVVVLVNR
jgi:hypothetical protein